MARHFSIRRRLGLQAIFTAAIMLGLAVAFVSAQYVTDRAFFGVVQGEILPAQELNVIRTRLQSIHMEIQSVLLAKASPEDALENLQKERSELQQSWKTYRSEEHDWHEDLGAGPLVAKIEANLPALETFLNSTEQAYRQRDYNELSRLAGIGWYELQQVLVSDLRALTLLEQKHVLTATRELERSIVWTRLAIATLLGAGLLGLALFSIRLGRHILRRIVAIEEALEAIAEGEQSVQVPYYEGESEMKRIASAINRTIAQIVEDRSALTGLMQQLQTVLNSVGEGIYGVDGDGRIMFMNPAALAMLGYQDVEVLGKGSHQLFHHHYPDGRPYPLEDCPIAASRQTSEIGRRDDEVFFRKDGTNFPVEYTSAALLNDNHVKLGAVVVFRDVTERRKQERLLQATVAQLRETNARLTETQLQLVQAEKLAGLGQLAAGVAHEMNNPLAFVSSNFGALDTYVQELLELVRAYEDVIAGANDPLAKSAFEQVKKTAEVDFLRDDLCALMAESREGLKRVAQIVADLKEFSRLDSSPGEWGDVDLNHCLDATVRVVAKLLEGKATVVREYASLPRIHGNALQLNQIFLNLLLNASHAITDHGTITLRTWQKPGEVCVEVVDTGCGMAPDVSQRMFDPFFTTRPVGQGKGLGLSVAYSIAQKHGGRFEVESAPGRGTSVRLLLPVPASGAEEPVTV